MSATKTLRHQGAKGQGISMMLRALVSWWRAAGESSSNHAGDADDEPLYRAEDDGFLSRLWVLPEPLGMKPGDKIVVT